MTGSDRAVPTGPDRYPGPAVNHGPVTSPGLCPSGRRTDISQPVSDADNGATVTSSPVPSVLPYIGAPDRGPSPTPGAVHTSILPHSSAVVHLRPPSSTSVHRSSTVRPPSSTMARRSASLSRVSASAAARVAPFLLSTCCCCGGASRYREHFALDARRPLMSVLSCCLFPSGAALERSAPGRIFAT